MEQKEKPLVLTLEEYNQFTKKWYAEQGISELWCKADILDKEFMAVLEYQAQQARTEMVGEIFEEIEKLLIPTTTRLAELVPIPNFYIRETSLQSLKGRFLKKKK